MHYEWKRNFLSSEEADYLYTRLSTDIPWTQVQYYKPERGTIITPRLTWVCGWHNESYSPLANQIPDWLIPLKEVVEQASHSYFNYMLFAYYRNGNDSISYHSDDERFLGVHPTIASITVGQERKFNLKNKHDKSVQSFNLMHGDLFIMKNNCQSDYMHSVPKSKKITLPRISITFRKVMNSSGSNNYYKYNAASKIN